MPQAPGEPRAALRRRGKGKEEKKLGRMQARSVSASIPAPGVSC